MDESESNLHSLGICKKVYIILTRTLARQALKTPTLGNINPNSTAAADHDQIKVHPLVQETPCERPAWEAEVEPEKQNNNAKGPEPEEKSAQGKTNAPKKAVSFSDKVEEIDTRKKTTKREKSKSSADQNLDTIDDEPKPLRSILKVGSNLNENST